MPDEKAREIVEDPAKVSQLAPKEVEELLQEAEQVFEKEPRLIEIPASGQTIFVGDTHGDFDATGIIAKRYLGDDRTLVFLGDYGRGKYVWRVDNNHGFGDFDHIWFAKTGAMGDTLAT